MGKNEFHQRKGDGRGVLDGADGAGERPDIALQHAFGQRFGSIHLMTGSLSEILERDGNDSRPSPDVGPKQTPISSIEATSHQAVAEAPTPRQRSSSITCTTFERGPRAGRRRGLPDFFFEAPNVFRDVRAV
jgi:hypothetical protein